jgi:general stress protein 26
MQRDNEDLKKFKDLVEDIKFAMLITKAIGGKPKGRPMATADVDEDGNIWFFTNEYSGKVEEIAENNEVILSYASPSDNTYLYITGVAELNDDRNKMKELWNPAYKAWFSEGLDDAKLFLLKINPTEAEYWDSPSSKVVMALGFIKSVVTGKESKGGEYGKLNV